MTLKDNNTKKFLRTADSAVDIVSICAAGSQLCRKRKIKNQLSDNTQVVTFDTF